MFQAAGWYHLRVGLSIKLLDHMVLGCSKRVSVILVDKKNLDVGNAVLDLLSVIHEFL